jgi:hypothetical protein
MIGMLSRLAMAAVVATALTAPVRAAEPDGADALLGAPAVSNEALGKANGRENIALNSADLNSVHGFNEANNSPSGTASIGANALSDIHGAAAVVVNSGNNAVVQVSQQVIFNLY